MDKHRRVATVSLMLLIALLMSLLAGCVPAQQPPPAAKAEEPTAAQPTEAPPPTTAPAAKAQGTISVWWWGEGGPISETLDKFVEESAKAYAKAANLEKVEPVRQGDNTVEAFKAAAEAKQEPDIGTIWYGVYQLEEVWAGNVRPLDDYVTSDETKHWIGTSLSTYDGKLWGGDVYAYGVTMVYNKELFKKAGLDPNNPPKTWDELLKACDSLKAAKIRPIAWNFSGAGWGTAVLSGFIWPQTLGNVNALKEAAIGKRKFTDPEYKELFVKLDELNKRGCFADRALATGDAATEFQQGDGAMSFPANFNAATMVKEMGADKVGLMYFPSITGKPVDWIQVAPITLFVTSWSKNPEAAAGYLKFLHSKEGMDLAMKVSDGMIVPGDDRFDTSQIADPTTRMLAEQIMGGFKAGTWFCDSLLPYAILDGALPAGQKMMAGEITPDQAAQMTEDAAEKWRRDNPEALANYMKWIGAGQ